MEPERPRGNCRQAALRRLRSESEKAENSEDDRQCAAELLRRVIAKEITPHAAMVEAGLAVAMSCLMAPFCGS